MRSAPSPGLDKVMVLDEARSLLGLALVVRVYSQRVRSHKGGCWLMETKQMLVCVKSELRTHAGREYTS